MSTREYKYFLLLDGGEDLEAMRAGAAHFIGEHDFRNFCKVTQTRLWRLGTTSLGI